MNKINTQTNIPLFIAAHMENRNHPMREAWITLPITKPLFLEIVGALCDSWDDFMIDMYYTSIPDLPDNKLMDAPLASVNHLAARLNKLTCEQVLKLFMILKRGYDGYDVRNVEQIIEYTYRPDRYEFLPGISSDYELGQYRINRLDAKIVPSTVIRCIDPVSFGMETALREGGIFTPLGYLTSSEGTGKAVKKRRIPDCWDIKDKDGADIFGEWYKGDISYSYDEYDDDFSVSDLDDDI